MEQIPAMELASGSGQTPAAAAPASGWRARCAQLENLLVVFCLAAMVLLPLIEALLRTLFKTGIAAAASLVQHCCLILGMIGGAIAARDQRLLSLSTLSSALKGRAKASASLVSCGFAAAISVVLCLASWRFMLDEKTGGDQIAYGLRVWMVVAFMPLGFGLIALRLIWHSSSRRGWRGGAALLAAAIVCAGICLPTAPAKLVLPGIALLLLATILGAPVFAALGGAAVIFFWGKSQPLTVLPIDHYDLVVNPTLPTIPLFTLAGYLLAEGGASKRLVRVCQALVGHLPGGPAIATALACAFFTSFTGASGVTILALGGLLMPVLVASRYSERAALGLITGAGSLGLLFPPCLPLILYGIIANVQIQKMFVGGILPGVLLVVLTAVLGIWQGPKVGQASRLPRQPGSSSEGTGEMTVPSFTWREAGIAIWAAKWELLLPVVALVALFGGFATTLEAAAITAFYAFVVEVFIYRDLRILKDLPRVMTECALLVGGVLLILGVALGLTGYFVYAEVPDKLAALAQGSIHSRWVFLLALNLFLLVVGCLMDIFSAIIVVVPLIVPLGAAFGVNPVHLGIIFLANLELGFLTPPVGMNLFLSSYRFNKPMTEVTRAVLPMLAILLGGVLLITYIPWLTTWLPTMAAN